MMEDEELALFAGSVTRAVDAGEWRGPRPRAGRPRMARCAGGRPAGRRLPPLRRRRDGPTPPPPRSTGSWPTPWARHRRRPSSCRPCARGHRRARSESGRCAVAGLGSATLARQSSALLVAADERRLDGGSWCPWRRWRCARSKASIRRSACSEVRGEVELGQTRPLLAGRVGRRHSLWASWR